MSHFRDHEQDGWGVAPPAGELSTSESAFLERSRGLRLEGSTSGLRGDSLFGDHYNAGFRNGGEASGGVASCNGNVATIAALRDRLATVEGENAALRARARRAEEERATEAARGDRASKKLAQVRVSVVFRSHERPAPCSGANRFVAVVSALFRISSEKLLLIKNRMPCGALMPVTQAHMGIERSTRACV